MIQNKNKKKWNDFFSSKERPAFMHLTTDQIDQIQAFFPNAKTALDIGCGEGELLCELEKRDFITTGIDLSEVAINKASLSVRGKLLVADFEDISPEKLGHFDIVFAKFVVAFFSDLDLTIKKAADLINVGGGFVVLTPVLCAELDSINIKEEIFVHQTSIESVLSSLFNEIHQITLHREGLKKLSLYICR